MRGIIDILIARNCFRINLVITFLVCKIETWSNIKGKIIRIPTAAPINISTSNRRVPVPITTQKKHYFTTQEQPTHSTYSALAMAMETTSKDITSASLGICIFVFNLTIKRMLIFHRKIRFISNVWSLLKYCWRLIASSKQVKYFFCFFQ